jgi:antitoxin HigA-1
VRGRIFEDMDMTTMHNPSHPGLILREDVLPELQLSVNKAAEQLGVSRVTLSRVINGRAAISADMALRIGKWIGNGPEIWMRMQGQYDLWQARKKGEPRVKKAKRPVPAPAEA